MISSTATESDGLAFAVAAHSGWLIGSLHSLAERLEAALKTLGPELAAAHFDMNPAFVRGFAEHVSHPMRARPIGLSLTVELSLTTSGLAADTFCWKDDSDSANSR
jgi:hypothetical protein